jgi:hypothetical protein
MKKYTVVGVFELRDITANSEAEALEKARRTIAAIESRNSRLVIDPDTNDIREQDGGDGNDWADKWEPVL